MCGKSLSLVLWALLLVGQCWCDDGLLKDRSVVVVGTGECVDCAQQKIKSTDAFSGLHVAIDCKAANSNSFQTRGVGEFDKDGKFNAKLPSELVNDDGELTEECFAQLHSASRDPCPAQNGLEQVKIVLKSKDNGKHTFTTAGKLSFTPSICTSELLWPLFKHFPLPKFPPIYKKPLPPIYKKPMPPPIPKFPPIYKKPLPPLKPKLPPIYKKPMPPLKPKFPPIYKKPMPPLKPKFPPIYKKPMPPFKEFPPLPPKPMLPPFYSKPFAHLPKFPPIYKKKPLPPLPKFPPIYKKKPMPPLPKFPPIYKKKPMPPLPMFPPIYKKKPMPPLPMFPPIYKKKPMPHLPKFPPIYKKKPLPPFGGWSPHPPFSP